MDWIQQWQSKLNKQNGVAPLVRTGGSRHTGLAALPYRNIHIMNPNTTWLRDPRNNHQALQKIAEFYRIDTELKELPATDRLTQRQTRIKPLVEDFFAWAKQQVTECAVPPKSRTGQGLNFVIHQEKYLKIFLTDGDIPIDNSASERAIRTFCIGKKNWMFHNTAKGAGASALVYSISETAKLNNLRPYYYFRHILTELPKYCDEKGNINPAKLDQLMPWAEELPEECRKPRRS